MWFAMFFSSSLRSYAISRLRGVRNELERGPLLRQGASRRLAVVVIVVTVVVIIDGVRWTGVPDDSYETPIPEKISRLLLKNITINEPESIYIYIYIYIYRNVF